MGGFEEAKLALSAAQRTFSGNWAPTQIRIACKSDLTQLLQDQGKLNEARPLMLEVLEAFCATLGHKHPSTLISTSNLQALQGRLGEADALAWESAQSPAGQPAGQAAMADHIGGLLVTLAVLVQLAIRSTVLSRGSWSFGSACQRRTQGRDAGRVVLQKANAGGACRPPPPGAAAALLGCRGGVLGAKCRGAVLGPVAERG